MRKLSFKEQFLRILSETENNRTKEPLEFVFYTSAGIFSGKARSLDAKPIGFSQIIDESRTSFRAEISSDDDTKHMFIVQDEYIVLEDVTHIVGDRSLRISEVVLFADQIVGFTVGRLDVPGP